MGAQFIAIAGWSTPQDGTSVGPTRYVPVEGHEDAIAVTPLWSDEEGVTADVQVPDHPLNINTLGRLMATINNVILLGPPM